jgi:cation-transporting P-type ATPase E
MSTAVAPTGLTAAEVAERVASGQVNDVPPAPTRTVAEIVRANVLTRFNFLLGSLLVVILWVGPLQDALFGLVLVANTLVGIVQEVRAKRTLDRLALISAPAARVVRDGRTREVAVGEVVLDDLLRAGPGEQLVVDGEVVEAAGAEVDESLLTGESEPVGKRPGDQVLSGSFVAPARSPTGPPGSAARRTRPGWPRRRGASPWPARSCAPPWTASSAW